VCVYWIGILFALKLDNISLLLHCLEELCLMCFKLYVYIQNMGPVVILELRLHLFISAIIKFLNYEDKPVSICH
jgi:hypothetical protein